MADDSITVYCTKGNVIFNSNSNLKESDKKKTFKLKKFIVNSLFHSMREYNKDPFWDIFLMKASRDNFPKGFSFKDNIIYYSLKAKYNFELKLNEENIESSFFELKKFVSDKGILSDQDKESLTQKSQQNNSTIEEELIETWKELGKIQNNSVYTYISKLTSQYDLTFKERKNLESQIKIGISSGYLNNKNIVVKNCTILDIVPLLWDKDNRSFIIDTKNIRFKRNKSQKAEAVDISTDNTTTCLDFQKKYNISNISKKWEKLLASIYKY